MDGFSSNFGYPIHSESNGSKPHGHKIWMMTDPLMLDNTKEPHDAVKRVREPHYNWKKQDTSNLDTNKRVRRNTWSGSLVCLDDGPGTSIQRKRQKNFSEGSTDDKTGKAPEDFLGSILCGMKDRSHQKQKWDGQPRLPSPGKLHIKGIMTDSDNTTSNKFPPVLNPSLSLGIQFKQKRIGNRISFSEREQLQSKARSLQLDQANLLTVTRNGTASVVQNTDGNLTKKHDKDKKSDSKKKKPNGQEKTNKKHKSNNENADSMKNNKPNDISNWLKKNNDEESSANKKERDENSDKKIPMQMTRKDEPNGIRNWLKKQNNNVNLKKKMPMQLKKKGKPNVISYGTMISDWLKKCNNEKDSANNKDEGEKSNSKKKLSMEKKRDTKAWRSKSNWKGSRKLGSTRTTWRPDRAYDFGRNHMEINDYETPNDDFDLCRF